MILYGDTSALAKIYLDEVGSVWVQNILAETTNLFTSALTELELASSTERAKQTRRIDSPQYRTIYSSIERDFNNQPIVTIMDIDRTIWLTAKRLIRQRRLRVPDAIHLSTALTVDGKFANCSYFLCADQALLQAARCEGLSCLDPLDRDS
jgi:uncharacterized protein